MDRIDWEALLIVGVLYAIAKAMKRRGVHDLAIVVVLVIHFYIFSKFLTFLFG